MGTDFFEDQEKAKSATGSLIFYFAFGTLGVMLAAGALLYPIVFFSLLHGGELSFKAAVDAGEVWPKILAGAGSCLFVGVVILIASRWKIKQLANGGGDAVAKMLGGRVVPSGTKSPLERQLLNVVEEMAIASGVPVPTVYLLNEEEGINAFAAGYDPYFAVLGITRGACELLSRDELQGVIGHEFSHVLNGDMRINIRLMGMVHGITFIGTTGRVLMMACSGSRRSSNNKGFLPGILLGLGLWIVGGLGTLFGNIIKSAVSRQREYLADSASVQFTRNPDGLSGALKKIGGYDVGSRVYSPHADEVSHMFFGASLFSWLDRLFATHPPLEQRIKRIDPLWDEPYPSVDNATREQVRKQAVAEISGFAAQTQWTPNAEISMDSPTKRSLLQDVGRLEGVYIDYSRKLLRSLPAPVIQATRAKEKAPQLVYALLLSKESRTADMQLDKLLNETDIAVHDDTIHLAELIHSANLPTLLPIIDLAIPALRELSKEEYVAFVRNIKMLILADKKITLFEWTLQRVLRRHLSLQYMSQKNILPEIVSLNRVTDEYCRVLSTLALYGACSPKAASKAYAAALEHLPEAQSTQAMLAPKALNLKTLGTALDTLERLSTPLKGALLTACATCISHDSKVTTTEGQLLRAIADSLGCPMPPLLPGQPLV